jgi:hypothetical protein
MKALKLALAGLLMLCALSPAPAKTVITYDEGGVIVDFIKKYSDMRDRGEKVVVDGPCISSCTLLLGLLRPENYCATDSAVFGFHSASLKIKPGDDKPPVFQHASEMSTLMFDLYPGKVRSLLTRLGWNGDKQDNAHPEVIWVKGKQMRLFVRPCLPADLS